MNKRAVTPKREELDIPYDESPMDTKQLAPSGPDLSYNIVGTRPEEIYGDFIDRIPNTQDFTSFNPTGTEGLFDNLSGNNNTGSNLLERFLNTTGDTLSNYANNPSALAAIATAAQQWNNASKYGDMASEASSKYDPFGQYRQGYGDKLKDLYADPSSIENTPGYKFRLNQGMGIIGPKAAASHQGYGNEFRSMQDYAQGLASTEWGNEVDRLSKLAGANIDGRTAAQMEMNGLNAQVEAQNGALQALFTPFGQNTGDSRQGVTINNNNGGGSGSGGGTGKLTGQQASQAAAAIAAGGMGAWNTITKLIDSGYRYITNPDGSTTDLFAAARMTSPTGEDYTPYPTDSFGPEYTQIPYDPNLPNDSGYDFGGNQFPDWFEDDTGYDFGGG